MHLLLCMISMRGNYINTAIIIMQAIFIQLIMCWYVVFAGWMFGITQQTKLLLIQFLLVWNKKQYIVSVQQHAIKGNIGVFMGLDVKAQFANEYLWYYKLMVNASIIGFVSINGSLLNTTNIMRSINCWISYNNYNYFAWFCHILCLYCNTMIILQVFYCKNIVFLI